MQLIDTEIEGVIEIVPSIFPDSRGWFFETYKQSKFEEKHPGVFFVQENMSFSYKGVLRGLHFQKGEHAQGKLVQVIKGKVFDVAVDIRPNSTTFGKYVARILDDQKHNMLYVPPGFAHGFYALEETIFHYKCTNYYNKASESGILWNDVQINIQWDAQNPIISEKDLELKTLSELEF